ncbi:transmembrane protein 273 [Acomys russatus]|uniref:transmembrane protein 273 n=1 Tax=Acomys russatus TaxID=60746 RepID=UPI0021E33C35|nr:transmembrane protein 273 [Acomys russatus]
MASGLPALPPFMFLAVGGAQVLATGKSSGTEIDFKYAIIGMVLGAAISAGFLALKICMIRRHLSDLKNTSQEIFLLKKRSPSLLIVLEGSPAIELFGAHFLAQDSGLRVIMAPQASSDTEDS